MFSWICPKCGKEVPPSYSECPNCADLQAGSSEAANRPEAEAATAAAPAGPVREVPPAPAAPGSGTETVWPSVEPREPKPGKGSKNWLFGLLIGAALVVIGLTALVTLRSRPGAQPAAGQPGAALENPPLNPAAALNPAFKDIELGGFRIIENERQKPELRFVVVNHSGADLGEVKAKVNLRAATNDQGAEPVATFTFAVKLGPYESKELKVALVTNLRAYELPDWQRLRAEISQ